MYKYDIDKSGDIDFEEFKQMVYDGLFLEGTIGEYEEAFRAVDKSGNGSIGGLAAWVVCAGQDQEGGVRGGGGGRLVVGGRQHWWVAAWVCLEE
jgi:hypothetical protein